MGNGNIMQFDTPAAIYDTPANRFVASFVGVPEMNFIEGELKSENGATMFISEDITLSIPESCLPKEPHTTVVLGIRPENITVGEGVGGTVKSFERHGDHTDLFLTCGNTLLSARQHGTHQQIEESSLGITIDPNHVHFFACGENGRRL
jgi:ABC-type sugar transport system ATPase subunit